MRIRRTTVQSSRRESEQTLRRVPRGRLTIRILQNFISRARICTRLHIYPDRSGDIMLKSTAYFVSRRSDYKYERFFRIFLCFSIIGHFYRIILWFYSYILYCISFLITRRLVLEIFGKIPNRILLLRTTLWYGKKE